MKAVAKLDVVKGRRELGWEGAYVAVAGTSPTAPVASIVLNNDADFVVTRCWVGQFAAGSPILLPDSITMNIRDSATGNTLLRQPGRVRSFASTPHVSGYGGGSLITAINPDGYAAFGPLGLPAPYLMRRASSAFIEFHNPAGYSFAGDLYVGFEGFRVYPGESDPIPTELTGYTLPFSWNGTLALPNALSAGLQLLGTVEAQGPGVGRYYLKVGRVSATGQVARVATALTPNADNVLFMNVRDSRAQMKSWARMTQPPALGQFLPASYFTGGGLGYPWAQPRFLSGEDKVFVDVYGDPTSFTSLIPGTIEVQLNGVFVP